VQGFRSSQRPPRPPQFRDITPPSIFIILNPFN
jgi:hypothetical protein